MHMCIYEMWARVYVIVCMCIYQSVFIDVLYVLSVNSSNELMFVILMYPT